jgi:hypothetical protein
VTGAEGKDAGDMMDDMGGGRMPSIFSSFVAKECLKWGKLFCRCNKNIKK